MLKGVDPVLTGELLKVLDEMGHGDTLLLVDRNYPAHASGKPVIHLGDITQTRAAEAILSVFPLDTFVERPLERMEVDDDPSIVVEVQDEVLEVARAGHEKPLEYGIVPRLEFYERAKGVYAVVKTLESRPYGCFILQKGVVFD
ncbi:RbsD/FucU family protein [Naasia sp. SYSU D00057]|uniref:RbsD/FucU family protein n=1 Tax=Naasia sp. SYSU D00057 TaxID=2817380 RepID=UPI001B30B1AB|nr:RbsD/FucU domain-containing protein [Naasia sp. SYSU D00057]